MSKFFFIMAGGGIGALCRYSVALCATKVFPEHFPIGTFIANMIGCFLIGIAFTISDQTNFFSPSARLFFMTGFLGALTTFSTYALETFNAGNSGSLVIAIANFLANNIGGLFLFFVGMWLTQTIIQGKLNL